MKQLIILLAVVLSGCAPFNWSAVSDAILCEGQALEEDTCIGGAAPKPDVIIYICADGNPACAEASR